jgi:DNA invertase Pin-like site-specific DNA recombinase
VTRRVQQHSLPKVAAVYSRVSTKEQEQNGETSPQTQQDGCRARALANGYAVADSLRDRAFIQRELAAMQATDTLGADALAVIDDRVAGVTRRLTNLRRLAEQLDDPDQTAQLAEDITGLIARKRALARSAGKSGARTGLVRACRRELGALGYDARLYRAKHAPRATLALPLAGTLPVVPMEGGREEAVFTCA